MRVYRYQYKKKKRIKRLPVAVLLVAAAVLLIVKGNGELFFMLDQELKLSCYEDILGLYMPGVLYSGTAENEKTVAQQLLSHFFLLEDEAKELEDYPTQVESVLSYEAILAREAADENYVDEETGEVVLTGDTPEAQQNQMGETGTGSPEVTGNIGQAADEAAQTGEGEVQPNSDGTAQQAAGAFGTSGEKQVTYSREKLNDFDYLVQNFYQVDSTTTIGGDQLNADALLGKDMRLSHDASTPQILIYHTHSQEGYADSIPGDPATSVVGVGDYLTKILTEQYGFNVIHHKGEYDVGDRDHAYSKAGPGLEQVLAENPSIEVVIDLHRDGVAEGTKLVTNMNGTDMAQIMFFNGLSRTTSTGDIDYLYNPYLADNLAMSFQMQLKAAEYYPGFTRRIYLKGYRYNMHYCPKTLLIEVGAQTNTVQEAMNSMVPLADILNKVLTGPQ